MTIRLPAAARWPERWNCGSRSRARPRSPATWLSRAAPWSAKRTLCLNGTVAGPIELRGKGTLAGTGTLNGDMAFEAALNHEGCRIMPGSQADGFGTLTFGKSLVLPGDVYVEIRAAEGQSAKVMVNGDLTLEAPQLLHRGVRGRCPCCREVRAGRVHRRACGRPVAGRGARPQPGLQPRHRSASSSC